MKALAFSGGKDSMACLHLLRGELDCAIYVDTGYTFPETEALVSYAETILTVHRVKVDRDAQTSRMGIPADVVPIDWTDGGQLCTNTKPVKVQSYLQCCIENIAAPLYAKAKELGVTHLVCGQRNEEGHKSTSRHETVIDGIVRLHPIEDWTTQQVLSFLLDHMAVPTHYAIKHSSLDCYDCTAYRKESGDRVRWMKGKHPEFHAAYLGKRQALESAITEALA